MTDPTERELLLARVDEHVKVLSRASPISPRWSNSSNATGPAAA